jgi:hypothetical protein
MQIANKCMSPGIEPIQSTRRGKPEIAFPILEDVGYVIATQGGRVIGVVFIPGNVAGRTIEHAHARMPCTHPEQAGVCVQAEGPKLDIADAGWIGWSPPVIHKPAAGPIETAQSPRSTHPQRAGFVLKKRHRLRAGQAHWIIRSMAIVNKRIRVPIVPVDAPVDSYPQSAGSIQIEPPNTVGAEAAVILIVVLVNLERVAVVTVQTTEPRAKPHESLPVLDNRPHIAVGESLSNRQMGEARFRGLGHYRDPKNTSEKGRLRPPPESSVREHSGLMRGSICDSGHNASP